jgi:hypothetical protein
MMKRGKWEQEEQSVKPLKLLTDSTTSSWWVPFLSVLSQDLKLRKVS